MEKPLHVRVAEALGCKPEHHPEWDTYDPWYCCCSGPDHCSEDGAGRVARYDLEWSDTGPLIERFRIELTPPGPPDGEDEWGATTWDPPFNDRGPTPLLAVCNLILKLDQAGKLPSSRSPRPSEPPSPLG